jgi:inositol-pentakisphosphate 2-kinase
MTSLRCRLANVHDQSELNNAFTFRYLAEGAANIVFSIREHHGLAKEGEGEGGATTTTTTKKTPLVFVGPRNIVYQRGPFTNYVLRLSKGLDKTPSGQQNMHDFQHTITPLFDTRGAEPNFLHNLMDMSLVALDRDVLPLLESEVVAHSRRFRGAFPQATKVGLLVEDMSSDFLPGAVTIEIKPKWLVQSPNAPAGAKRCRTCAMQALKASRGKADAAYICPLVLLRGDADAVRWLVEQKVYSQDRDGDGKQRPPRNSALLDKSIDLITDYLAIGRGHALLQHLAIKQAELDPLGVLSTAPQASEEKYTHNLRLAMTLRDCSLFIKCELLDSGSPRITGALGDLDFKSEDKIADWRAKEEQLIAEGCYVGKGDGDGVEEVGRQNGEQACMWDCYLRGLRDGGTQR